MCGITGYAGFDGRPHLQRMCDSLTHRGPDDEGSYTGPQVGLAMRRLAVIDLASGHQPIANEDRDVWVVFNGEIYNYEDLRRALIDRGHRFSTTSDTETIVHLYEEHGLDFVHHLRGMFAIALWDAKAGRLVLTRDRIGEKPLYFAPHDGGLVFGSELKAILAVGGRRAVNRQAIRDFLAMGYVAGAGTVFDGITKLPPAHRLVFEQGRTTVDCYWRRGTHPVHMSEAEASSELRERLQDTVRLCLKSDVEVGAFLSGGLDSSLLVALMRRQSARVQTFTVGYSGAAAGFNELEYARRVSAALGTTHHELILKAHSTLDDLPRVLRCYDEPHGEPTSTLVYQLSEFTRARVKVAIGGTGGDELFYGYPRHRAIEMLGRYRRVPRVLRRHVFERLVASWPESTTGSRLAKRVRRFVAAGDAEPAEAYLSWVRLLDRSLHADLFAEDPSHLADPSGDAFLRSRLVGGDDRSLLDRATDVDVDRYLPEFQLTYMDRMSMAHGLEVRSPLCDFELVDFVTSLPPAYRLKNGRSKHLLKNVASEWLPASIVDRPKVGFDSPIGHWFKHELRDFMVTFLAPDEVRRTGLLSAAAVQRLIADHTAGVRDYSMQLWSVLAVEMWYRMYIEADGSTPGDCRLTDIRGVRAGIRGEVHRALVDQA